MKEVAQHPLPKAPVRPAGANPRTSPAEGAPPAVRERRRAAISMNSALVFLRELIISCQSSYKSGKKLDFHGEHLMIERRGRMGIVIGAGAFALATAVAGCSGLGGSHIDCNVVKLQSQSGRSSSEIASALGVSEDEVNKCPAAGAVTGSEGSGGPPNASDYGIPAGVEGGDTGGAAAPAPAPQ